MALKSVAAREKETKALIQHNWRILDAPEPIPGTDTRANNWTGLITMANPRGLIEFSNTTPDTAGKFLS